MNKIKTELNIYELVESNASIGGNGLEYVRLVQTDTHFGTGHYLYPKSWIEETVKNKGKIIEVNHFSENYNKAFTYKYDFKFSSCMIMNSSEDLVFEETTFDIECNVKTFHKLCEKSLGYIIYLVDGSTKCYLIKAKSIMILPIKNGFHKSYYIRKNLLEAEENYVNGVLHGFCKYYDDWDSNTLSDKGYYENGKKVGIWESYSRYSSSKVWYHYYIDGVEVSEEEYMKRNKFSEIIIDNDNILLTKSKTEGFWLYDKILGLNIATKAKTEIEALSDGLIYYQTK
jgi:hypothetical protein